VAGSLPNTTKPARKDPEAPARRYYNDAVIALDQLFEAAAGGNHAAQEMLRSLADQLLDAAGKLENAAARTTLKSKKKVTG
jgi:predicted NBD/HSP70 family sugar kinase